MTPLEQAIQYYNEAVRIGESDKQLQFKFLVSSVEAAPEFSIGWFAIGNMCGDLQLRNGAAACLRRAVELNPNDAKMLTNLSHILYHTGELEESEEMGLRAIAAEPELANAYMNLSLVYSLQSRIDESLKVAKKAFSLDKTPTTEMTLAFAYLHARELDKGLKHFEAKLPYKLPQYLSFPWPRWRGEDIRGKTLFVIADQGLGDTLCFLRFLPEAAKRCERIIMHIQGDMMRMASMMLMDYPNIDIAPLNAPLPTCDTWVAITSLPVALNLTSAEIEHTPLMGVPVEMPPEPPIWKAPGRKIHIGISWKGSDGNDIDRHRSMPVENFLAMSKVPGVQLYGLQIGPRAADIHTTGSAAIIKDLSPWVRDVYDTACILPHLDLIVSIESFLPHLASALGMEAWILYSQFGKDWRIGQKGQRIIWHHKPKLFHQDKSLSWVPAFEQINAALRERIE